MAETTGSPSQKFRAIDADKTNDLVSRIRLMLNAQPIAIARAAIAIIHDDIQIQLQFKRVEFE